MGAEETILDPGKNHFTQCLSTKSGQGQLSNNPGVGKVDRLASQGDFGNAFFSAFGESEMTIGGVASVKNLSGDSTS